MLQSPKRTIIKIMGVFRTHPILEGGGGGGVEINRAWESIKENMKDSATDSLGYYVMKEHKP
jgi:hypothetical protein